MIVKPEPRILRRGVAMFIDLSVYVGIVYWVRSTYGTLQDDGSYALTG